VEAINLAIAGVGNCASSLLQGFEYYRRRPGDSTSGLMHTSIGGYTLADIRAVAAFDVDRRKVGLPLEQAVFAEPNCTTVFQRELPHYGVTVQMGPRLDGIPQHMFEFPDRSAFRPAEVESCDVVRVLRESGAHVLVCYMPVGSEQAVHHYANACLEAGVAFVNCMPVFIASDPEWSERFRARGLPVVGDDIKSQVGATIVHRVLARLLSDRGVRLEHTYQLNTGGNTDFLNMLERHRLRLKRISKTESVQSQLDCRLDADCIHIGPSDYVPWQKDNKVCFLRLEWRGFGDVPMNLELRLSVEDSPNSAGVAIDAIRCARLAMERGIGGPLLEVSAVTMKHPLVQMRDSDARARLDRWIAGEEIVELTPHPRLVASAAEARNGKPEPTPVGANGSAGNGSGHGSDPEAAGLAAAAEVARTNAAWSPP
jgi:myo-inositol-1-phosphate synthase